MAYEHQPGSFSLFKNDKGDNEKRPDYRGEGRDLEGNAIEVVAWINEPAKGGKFMSCRFKVKEGQQAKAEPKKAAPKKDDIDDIPF